MRKLVIYVLLLYLWSLVGCGRTTSGVTNMFGGENDPPQIISLSFMPSPGPNAPHEVSFTAVVEDPDNNANELSYAWAFGDGTTTNALAPVHNYLFQGTFTFTLTVYDRHGAYDQKTGSQQIILTAGNRRPTITTCNASKVTASIGESISFSGDGTDEDIGDNLTFSWDFGDGNTALGKNVAHSFSNSGVYTVRFTVTEDPPAPGASARHDLLIGVETNLPPIIQTMSFVPTRSSSIPVTASYSATATDVDGTIVSYYWEFGDGQNLVSQNPTHVYTTVGNMLVKLTVVDNEGGTAVSQNYLPIYTE